jgi:hypothetical protein
VQFGTAFGLLVALLVVAPYLAHRLRRKKSERLLFAPAAWVEAVLPKARKRSNLEDKALFAARMLAVVLLGLLASIPLVRCNRVSLTRSGASIAVVLVVDDSLSMRAANNGSTTFARARTAAKEAVDSLQEGDSISIVLAGAPVRVALAPTTSLAEASAVLDAMRESDRGTDLEGALKTAESLVTKLPHVDKRVVLLSDLADGSPSAEPLRTDLPLWSPLAPARERLTNCAVVEATHTGASVKVRVVCNDQNGLQGRKLEVHARGANNEVLGSSLGAPLSALADSQLFSFEDSIALTRTSNGNNDAATPSPQVVPELSVHLVGKDAIAADDQAPVLTALPPGSILLVGSLDQETSNATGLALTDRALRALRTPGTITPLPAFPDTVEDLAQHVAIVADDPPGLTPEQRRALTLYVERGGVVLFALGPNAARPPLGASFEPFLTTPTQWQTKDIPAGIDVAKATLLGESALSAADLTPRGRTLFALEQDSALLWKDAKSLVARKPFGRGEVWLLGLPLSPMLSDLPIRPAFLALLDSFVREGMRRQQIVRSDVGATWTFEGNVASATGPDDKPLDVRDGRYTPDRIGQSTFFINGKPEVRIARATVPELELTPRRVAESEVISKNAAARPNYDLSRWIAFALLVVFVGEILLRVVLERKKEA